MSISSELGEQATVDLPQGTVSYRERGEGPPVLFVHGLFVNGDHWRKVVPLLAGSHRCITPDLPLGAHSRPLPGAAERTVPATARLLADFLAALDLTGVTVVGNDTGDAIVQVLVTEHPERIGRVVLTPGDAFTNFLPWVIKPVRPLALWPAPFDAVLGTLRTRAMQWVLLVSIAHRFPPPEILDSYFGAPLRDAGVRRDLREFIRHASPRHTLRAARKLRSLAFPALIVWTRTPSPVFPKAHGRRLARIIPDARHEEVADALAFLPEDQPERLAELIRDFVPAPERVA